MNPSRPFILRPVATALLMAAMFLAGGVAFFSSRSRRCLKSITPLSRSSPFTPAPVPWWWRRR